MNYEYYNTHEGIIINISLKYEQKKKLIINKCIEETIEKIPQNIMEHLKLNNFAINVLSKGDLKTKIYLEYDGITKDNFKVLNKWETISFIRSGCFIWGKRCIYVMPCKDMGKIILHEIGHFLDYIGKYPLLYEDLKELRKNDKKNPTLIKEGIKPFRKSGNSLFFTIYKKEKKRYRLCEGHYKNKYSEHFAESFARYLIGDSKFNSKFPKTKEYIEEFIDNFKAIEIIENN